MKVKNFLAVSMLVVVMGLLGGCHLRFFAVKDPKP
jgi:hypothetical protein